MNKVNRIKRDALLQSYYVSCFVSLILILSIASVPGLSYSIARSDLVSGWSGEWSKSIEDKYDERFALKSLGVNIWGAVNYLVFSQGRPGLVVGNDSWLFSTEEIHHPLNADRALAKNLQYMSWVKKHLNHQGIDLVVAPVPAKARLYSKQLGEVQTSSVHKTLYRRLIRDLSAANISVVDTYSAMVGQDKPMFFRTDTHWTPAGAEVAAKGVSQQYNYMIRHNKSVRSQWLVESGNQFVTEAAGDKILEGDLMNFLALSPWFSSLLPATESYSHYKTYRKETQDLFAVETEASKVALVGTSYSANSHWNFSGALKVALSHGVMNFSEAANGPFVPMARFIENNLPNLKQLRLVVWEIPERYLLIDYSAKMDYSHLPIENGVSVSVLNVARI